MASDFVLTRELAFHETDMAGIAHFSNFFRWMEMAEHAFLKELGFPPVQQEGSSFRGWPRVRASCEYHEPLRYGEMFDCHLFVKEIKEKAVVYFFRFRKKAVSAGGWTAVAKGEMTSIFAGFDVPTNTMRALDLDAELLGRLETASAELMKVARDRRPDGR